MIPTIPATPDAYRLLHEGSIVLATMEANGMRVDVDYLDRAIVDTEAAIAKWEGRLRSCEEYRLQQRRYGSAVNLTSRDQLATVLFQDMGYESTSITATGRAKLDGEALERVGTRYTKGFIELEKLNKALGTYLRGIRSLVDWDGMLRPFFNLNTVQTYRSSSDNPNFQNIPIRDPFVASLVRRAFIPRDGHQIIEIDLSGAEVRVAACYHRDPTMLAYIADPTKDMHRDMADQCYMLGGKVPKPCRQAAKGGFVFAAFYGDWYKSICQNLWNEIGKRDLQTADGCHLYDHLAALGVVRLGDCDPRRDPEPETFEAHIKAVEADFWGNRFAVYDQWRKQWYADYLRTGGFSMLTGFRVEGVFRRNEVINAPVQGSSFHCLLWSLVQLQKAIEREDKATKLIGQIHDSIVADVPTDEREWYLATTHRILTVDLPRAWNWLIVPIEVEAEAAPPGASWYEKQKVDFTCLN